MLQDHGFNEPSDIQERVDEPVEFNDRAQPVIGFTGQQYDLSAPCSFYAFRRNGIPVDDESKRPFRQNATGSIKYVYFAQIPHQPLPGQNS